MVALCSYLGTASPAVAAVGSDFSQGDGKPVVGETGRRAGAQEGAEAMDWGIRGVTIGPIENAYHPDRGYGSPAFDRTLDEAVATGANWVAITPFGRVGSLLGLGVDPRFEAPFAENQRAIRRAVRAAHARGLRVFLVPHLWVESGEWRALIDPKTDAGWRQWAGSYSRYVLAWAALAEDEQVELFAAGVELRSWVTSARAPLFSNLLREIRRVYRGQVTYSANWDDVDDTVILGELDVIGINAFFPLAHEAGASLATLRQGGAQVAVKVAALAARWQKPVLFTEIGYTTRRDPAVEPWLWPDTMSHVEISQRDQARAYHGLLAPLLAEGSPPPLGPLVGRGAAPRIGSPGFAGFFVWRVYADPDDVSQEPEFGFSPRGKEAELVMRDAFAGRWPAFDLRHGWGIRARIPGLWAAPSWAGLSLP